VVPENKVSIQERRVVMREPTSSLAQKSPLPQEHHVSFLHGVILSKVQLSGEDASARRNTPRRPRRNETFITKICKTKMS